MAGIKTDLPSLLDYLTPRPALDRDDNQIAGLVRQLGSDEFKQREQAAMELMACGRKALPALERARESGDTQVAAAARSCIRDIEARTNPEFVKAEEWLIVRLPAESCGSVKDLLENLGHANATVRRSSFNALCKRAGPGDFDDVVRFTRDKRPVVRGAAVGLLYKYRDRSKTVIPILLDAIRDEDASVRYRAATPLGHMGPSPEVVAALVEALKDTDPIPPEAYCVASAAMNGLVMLGAGARPAIPDLIKLSTKGPERARDSAIRSLGWLGRADDAIAESVIPTLVALLRDRTQSMENRGLAAFSLGNIGPKAKAAVPALREALMRVDEPAAKYRERVYGNALCALRELGPSAEPAIPELIAILQTHEDENRRQVAAEALGSIGPGARTTIPILTMALKDPVAAVRQAAQRSLDALGR
jgi:HEAT repeat protein